MGRASHRRGQGGSNCFHQPTVRSRRGRAPTIAQENSRRSARRGGKWEKRPYARLFLFFVSPISSIRCMSSFYLSRGGFIGGGGSPLVDSRGVLFCTWEIGRTSFSPTFSDCWRSSTEEMATYPTLPNIFSYMISQLWFALLFFGRRTGFSQWRSYLVWYPLSLQTCFRSGWACGSWFSYRTFLFCFY